MKKLLPPILTLLIAAGLLLGMRFGLRAPAERAEAAERQQTMKLLLPGSSTFTEEAYSGEDENVKAVYQGETGYVIETVTEGYVGPIKLWVGVDQKGAVTGVMVRDMEESFGLGRRATTDPAFLRAFLGTKGDLTVGENVDAITGATVSSKAITKGVNSASAFVTGADVSSGATTWGG